MKKVLTVTEEEIQEALCMWAERVKHEETSYDDWSVEPNPDTLEVTATAEIER